MTDFKALTPTDFKQPSIDQVKGLYQELLDRPVDGTNFIDFLTDFENLNACVEEAATLAQTAYDSDTTNKTNSALRDLWAVEIDPQLGELENAINAKILDQGIVPPDSEVAFRQWETARKFFRPENMELEATIAELESDYNSLIGNAVVEIGGQKLTLDQVDKLQLSTDRSQREEGWKATQLTIKELRPKLEKIWGKMWQLRQKIALNTGCQNYGEYFYALDTTRHYGQQECANFYHSISKAGRPILERMRQERKKYLGVAKLRPWDLRVDILNRKPLELGNDSKLIYDFSKQALQAVSPEVADVLQMMKDRNRLDLDNRLGKTPGAYQNILPHSKEPLIFMNAVGTVVDLQTLIHETGHAYHSIVSMRERPFAWEMHTDAEMAEVASMSMELMAYEHLGEIGIEPLMAKRMRAEQLEDILTSFAYCTTIDQLQHAAYKHPEGHNLAVADALYLERNRGVEAGVDWTGIEEYRAQRWHYQDHVWITPFYFIEYSLAQLAALNVWQQYIKDKPKTFERYKEALKLGNTKMLPDLYAAVGSPWEFQASYIGPILKEAEARWQELMAEQIARSEPSAGGPVLVSRERSRR